MILDMNVISGYFDGQKFSLQMALSLSSSRKHPSTQQFSDSLIISFNGRYLCNSNSCELIQLDFSTFNNAAIFLLYLKIDNISAGIRSMSLQL